MPSARRVLALGAAVVVGLCLVVLGLAAVALVATPVALVIELLLLAVVLTVGTRARRWSRWRHSEDSIRLDETGADTDGPVGDLADPARRPGWAAQWESSPPPTVVPFVRDQLRVVLAEWGLADEEAASVLLVVTELLTNAVVHGSAPVRVAITPSDGSVRVEVSDAAVGRPEVRPPDPWTIGGRGLALVEALSLRWGWTNDDTGKTVWADVLT
jgi:anti-sigma regulatory factor (Ser/Thr protein kinase)